MKSLSTALRVLSQFSENSTTLGVGEIAERCRLTKSQVSKILSTYREHGILNQDDITKRYSVSLRLFTIGSKFILNDKLTHEAVPLMRALVAESGHSTRLSVVDDNNRIVYLAAIEGQLFLHTGWRMGTIMPWHASAVGRLLLSFYPEAEQDRILDRAGLEMITPHTITDRALIKAMMRKFREQGWSIVRGETTVGLGAISTPIFGEDQALLGALNVVFPESSVAVKDEMSLVRMTLNYARMISLRCGAAVYPFSLSGEAPPLHSRLPEDMMVTPEREPGRATLQKAAR